MKQSVIIAAILLVILTALALVPNAAAYHQWLSLAALLVAVGVLLISLTAGKRKAPKPEPVVTESLKPAPTASRQDQARAEVITLLAVFQEKGRLIDFLMEDLTAYADEQVGAVARSVHQGCRAALAEHFTIEPVTTEPEGATISVPAGYSPTEFRLIGNLSGPTPFRGKLVHKGWRVKSVKLPRVLHADDIRLPAIAPAQVEVL
jgi:hypothetical protein